MLTLYQLALKRVVKLEIPVSTAPTSVQEDCEALEMRTVESASFAVAQVLISNASDQDWMPRRVAASGRVDLLMYLHSIGRLRAHAAVVTTIAMAKGDMDMLGLLHEWEMDCKVQDANWAAQLCRIPVLELLHGWGIDADVHGAYAAAFNGHVDTLRLLHGWGIDADVQGANVAASNGHVDTLRLLHGWRIDADRRGAKAANANGHTAVLRLLRGSLA